jgi:hypothetical protein
MRAVQTRRLSGRLAINQPLWSMGVELDHPIANDLERHPPIFAASVRLAPSQIAASARSRLA